MIIQYQGNTPVVGKMFLLLKALKSSKSEYRGLFEHLV
jgi:hypothetical protein